MPVLAVGVGVGRLHQMLLVPHAGAAGSLSPICRPVLQLLPPPPSCRMALRVIRTACRGGAERSYPIPAGQLVAKTN